MNADTHEKDQEPRPLRREVTPASEDAELAGLFGRVRPVPPLHELAVQRIRRGLEQRTGHASSRRSRWIRGALAVAASLFLLEAFAALAVSAWPASRRALLHALLRSPGSVPGSSAASPPISPGISPEIAKDPSPRVSEPPFSAAMVQAGPSEPAAISSVAAVPRQPRRMQEQKLADRNAPAVGAAAAQRGIDDSEVAEYLGALAELNARNDPAKALKMLEAYRAHHPGGLFREEVAVAEVRAEMLLGRERDALALLDGMQARGFGGLPQAAELGVLRVELLRRANRCAEALPLAVSSLEVSTAPAQRERLLLERGACDAALGNLESSQQDLRDYLRQFPHGRFEAELRERIARAAPAGE